MLKFAIRYSLALVFAIFAVASLPSVVSAGENLSTLKNRLDTETSITVAVASNFLLPLQTLLELPSFPQHLHVKLVVGSSGSLYAQAIHGAPFDVFLAADKDRPQRLAKKQIKGTQAFTYAFGRLVVYPAEPAMPLTSLNDAKRIAIANPTLAPYGQSANAFLAKQNINKPKIVYGNNVSHAFQFADTGNVDFAITAESLLIHAVAKSNKAENRPYLILPTHTYPEIEQQGVILLNGKVKGKGKSRAIASQLFVDFLLSKAAQTKLSTIGYKPVKPTSVSMVSRTEEKR